MPLEDHNIVLQNSLEMGNSYELLAGVSISVTMVLHVFRAATVSYAGVAATFLALEVIPPAGSATSTPATGSGITQHARSSVCAVSWQ